MDIIGEEEEELQGQRCGGLSEEELGLGASAVSLKQIHLNNADDVEHQFQLEADYIQRILRPLILLQVVPENHV